MFWIYVWVVEANVWNLYRLIDRQVINFGNSFLIKTSVFIEFANHLFRNKAVRPD